MTHDVTDDELVALYISEQNESTFRTLVERHSDRLFSRFLVELKNRDDAMDLEQQLWLQVFRNLPNYRPEGRFGHYASRIASNLLNDFWRSKGRRSDFFVENRQHGAGESENEGATGDFDADNYSDNGPSQDEALVNEELVHYLISVLVPQLPVEQRTAWLLRHESEYWEPGQRLDWHHLAELNGVSQDEIWMRFEAARNKMLRAATSSSGTSQAELHEEETLVFMIWSQAQRLRKEQQFTWDYFSDLLNVPANTMKTRYRAAQKFLNDGLTAKMAG